MKINKIEKVTDLPWINIFCAEMANKEGQESRKYMIASRKSEISIEPDSGKADAVVMVPIHVDENGERKIVIIKEYRIPIRDFEWGFPAGLIEEGATPEETAIKEMHEETGLKVTNITKVSPTIYNSAGMTDESVIMVYLECSGEPSDEFMEGSEEIDAFLLSFNELEELCKSNVKFGAKAWCIVDGMIQKGKL